MIDIWTGKGRWEGWRVTTDHPSCKEGQPVLVDPQGRAYYPSDIQPRRLNHAELAREIGTSRQALTGRRNRGTVPEPDGHDELGKPWWYETTVAHLFKK